MNRDNFEISYNMKNKKRRVRKATGIVVCIMIIVAIFIMAVECWGTISKILTAMFFVNNVFQWGGITAIIAIITFGYTAYNTQRKNKMDLVSKARIKWLAETREIIAEFTTEVYDTVILLNTYNSQLEGLVQQIEEGMRFKEPKELEESVNNKVKDIKNNSIKVQGLKDKLQLQFGADDYNDLFLTSFIEITKCYEKIVEYDNEVVKLINDFSASDKKAVVEYIHSAKTEIDKIDELLVPCVRNSQLYLKNEWDKAKKGK